jgi:hypothetical protein
VLRIDEKVAAWLVELGDKLRRANQRGCDDAILHQQAICRRTSLLRTDTFGTQAVYEQSQSRARHTLP